MPARSAVASTPANTVVAYLHAKDGNRPFLIRQAFDADATLTMIVKTGTISFPPLTQGREAIADLLVRQFGQKYENVRTFCLAAPPEASTRAFSCPWLVGMSEKESRSVRVGCGSYDWKFDARAPHLAHRLTITIVAMTTLAPVSLAAVMDWLAKLPYPWCPPRTALATIPKLAGLEAVRQWLSAGAL